MCEWLVCECCDGNLYYVQKATSTFVVFLVYCINNENHLTEPRNHLCDNSNDNVKAKCYVAFTNQNFNRMPMPAFGAIYFSIYNCHFAPEIARTRVYRFLRWRW